MNINYIPSTGTPPSMPIILSAATYDAQSDSIITIGGTTALFDLGNSDIYVFSLREKFWNKIKPSSLFTPNYISHHKQFLRSDRKILIPGIYSEMLILNLEDYSWSLHEVTGDSIANIESYALAQVPINGSEGFVLYGGLNSKGFSNDLFIVDSYTMVSKRLPNIGKPPQNRVLSTIVYYNESLYLYGYSIKDLNRGLEVGNELYRYDLNLEYWEIVETLGTPPEIKMAHFACVYNDSMFIMYGHRQDTLEEYDTVYKFDFHMKTWIFLSEIKDSTISLSAFTQVGSKFYLIFGRSSKSTSNLINYIDLSDPYLRLQQLTENWVYPPGRSHHCSFIVGENLYIFGGSSKNNEIETFYNDLWAFNFNTLTWSLITVYGSVPPGIKRMACIKISGEILGIFGGITADGLQNRLYYYHEPEYTWRELIFSYGPSVRSDSCLAFCNDKIFAVGGIGNNVMFNEVWIYDTLEKKFFFIEIIELSLGISSAQCWAEKISNSECLLSISGGINDFEYPSEDYALIHYFFDSNKYEIKKGTLGSYKNKSIFGAYTSVIINGYNLFRFGGVIFSGITLNNILVFDLVTGETKYLNSNVQFNLYGHTANYFKKKFYIFGGELSKEFYATKSNYNTLIYQMDIDDFDNISLKCSEGTYGPNCEPCPVGTYYFIDFCKPCPKGTYGKIKAATEIVQCIPCPAGYFSSKEGSMFCLQCESGSICPIGSSVPLLNFQIPLNSSIQPGQYNKDISFLSNVNIMWYLSIGISLFCILLTLVSKKVNKSIQSIDILVTRHINKLNSPVIYRQTSIGGLFTLLFILLSSVSLTIACLNFFYNNIDEYQALVPANSLDIDITSKSLQINTTFYGYGGQCEISNECISDLIITDTGLSYTKKSISCKSIKRKCEVTVMYENAFIKEKNSQVLFSLQENSSYAKSIGVNVTSCCSVPEKISSFFTYITTVSDSILFKGTDPSIFYAEFTPTVFYSESSLWDSKKTAYFVEPNHDPTAGSTVIQETLNINFYLRVLVVISESNTALVISRYLNQTWLAFLGVVLGSIFGLLGTIGGLMKMVEILSDKITAKIDKKQNFKKKIKKNWFFKDNFRVWEEKSVKVFPAEIHLKDYYKDNGKIMLSTINS